MHLGIGMNNIKKLCAEIDKCINDSLGCTAKKIEEWYGDSSLNFNITYQLGLLDIDIWRDRGLYSVFIASTNGSMFHSMDKICAFVNENNMPTSAVSYPHELTAQLEFVKTKQLEIEAIFKKENIDKSLNEYGECRSIPRQNA